MHGRERYDARPLREPAFSYMVQLVYSEPRSIGALYVLAPIDRARLSPRKATYPLHLSGPDFSEDALGCVTAA